MGNYITDEQISAKQIFDEITEYFRKFNKSLKYAQNKAEEWLDINSHIINMENIKKLSDIKKEVLRIQQIKEI